MPVDPWPAAAALKLFDQTRAKTHLPADAKQAAANSELSEFLNNVGPSLSALDHAQAAAVPCPSAAYSTPSFTVLSSRAAVTAAKLARVTLTS